jgi:GNAT superfamily N-acetyltransferase
MMKTLKSSDIAAQLNLPSKGDVVSGVTILDSESRLKDGTFGYKLILPIEVRRGDLNNVLRDFFSTSMISLNGQEYVVENHDYQTKPTRQGTILSGYIYLVPLSKSNPIKKKLTALQDFNKEYTEMVMATPGSYFKIEPYRGFNGPKFRAKLFSFVSNRGENYGYTDGKNLFYRRASLVAPQIKITKSPKNANMFYHTHPKKDEPTMSSADDYLLYIDMSYKPRNIRHFYTVMADRMDYFYVVPKPSKKKDYVRINEDKFIAELDNQIENIGKRLDEKLPNDSKEDDLHYCEVVTRDVVKWLNKKYAKYVTIKYKCYYRVRKNPDKPTGSDLHLGDEYIAKGLNDIKTGKYSWPEFGSKEKPEESYAYWHSRYFSMNKDMRGTGYIGLLPGDMRRLEVFLYDSYRGSNYSYNDILGILCLSYDINVRDSKITDGKDGLSRITDILDYLEIEDNVLREDIIMLDSIVSVPYGKLARSIDDHYFIIPMADFSIKWVEAMQEVKAGKRDKERAKYDIMVTLREKMGREVAKSLSDENRKIGRDIYSDEEPDPETGEREIIDPARTVRVYGLDDKGNMAEFQKDRINPPIGITKRDYAAFLPTRIFENPDLIAEIFAEDFKKGDMPIMIAQTNAYNIVVPVESSAVSMMIQSGTGKVQLFVPAAGFPIPEDPEQTVLDAFRILIEKLNTRGFDIPTDDIRIGNIEPLRNPNDGNLVAIMGPIKITKDKVIESLAKRLDGVIVTKYTTRVLKEYEKSSSLIEVTDEVFDKMAINGDILVITSGLDGTKRGLNKKDFASDGLILVDIDSEDLPFLMGSVPHVKTFFLQPTNEEAAIKQFLLQDVSPQEAERVSSSIEEVTDVDNVIEYDIDKPAGVIEEIYSELPRKNPFTDPSGSIYVPSGGQHYLRVKKNPNLGVVPTVRSEISGTSYFIDKDTGEKLDTTIIYDGALLEIVDGKWNSKIGDPIKLDSKDFSQFYTRERQVHEFNVAAVRSKDGSIRHIIEWTGKFIFTDKVTITGPVFLRTDPLRFREPKAMLMTTGIARVRDKVALDGIPADFQGRAKSQGRDPLPAYVPEIRVRPRGTKASGKKRKKKKSIHPSRSISRPDYAADYHWLLLTAYNAMRDGGEDFDGKAWWQEQTVWIHKKYGNELIPNAEWHKSRFYDPETDDKSADFDDLGKALPAHFTNQLRRIPNTKPLTPEHLFQMALNEGYASVSRGLTFSQPRDYVEFEEARRNPPKGIKISHYPDPDPESEEGTMRIDLHKDGENIGFLLHHERDGEVWLDYVNVVRDYRQEGLGKFLLDELRKMYKGKEIYLHAPLGQARDWVPEWYEKVGFKLIEPGSNKMVLQNPSPWRHGEQMKNDPFEDEFE